MGISFDHTTLGQRVLFGSGEAMSNTVNSVRQLQAERVLVIATSSAVVTANAIASMLPVVGRIEGVLQHVPSDRVEEATRLAVECSADIMVTVGGGSAIGLAKAVALRTGVPIIAVPTTFSGSEATDVWGITENQRKITGSDSRVLPRIVVYDASVTAGMTRTQGVSSGLNALAHAVDALWAPRADPINAALAVASLNSLVPALRALAGDDSSVEAREGVLYGAYLAAVAFASSGSGMHHKICHVLGGAYNLPHASMHAVILPYVTRFNEVAAPLAATHISRALSTFSAAAGLWRLREELDAPSSLGELGLREEDIPEAARLCVESVPPSNPRQATVKAVEDLLRRAWAGEPIHENPTVRRDRQ